MHRYIVNANPQLGGEHEVHRVADCPTLPHPSNQRALGNHSSCRNAIAEAKRRYPGWIIDGCRNCIPACHTR